MSRGVTPSETLGFTLGVSSGSAPLEAETEAASLGPLGARCLRIWCLRLQLAEFACPEKDI